MTTPGERLALNKKTNQNVNISVKYSRKFYLWHLAQVWRQL